MDTKCHAHAGHDHSPQPSSDQHDPNADYTCPMHLDVVQKGPGACPICGMALEPVAISLEDTPNVELIDMTRRFWIGALFTLPLFIIAMGEMVPALHLGRWITDDLSLWLQFVLATPVVLWAGWPFFERGWSSVQTGNLNMFTLIAIGVGVAFIYSAVAVLLPDTIPDAFRSTQGRVAVYFEAAAVIVVLILLGQMLELRARESTNQSIKALLNLSPPQARLVGDSGQDRDVPLETIQVGDYLRVRPGDTVPLDGTITEGLSVIDEAMISGEPIPVEKGEGDTVIGGTINMTGSFIMRADKIGRDTLLAQIVQMVADAQRSQAPIQSLADTVAGYFVPIVIGVAVLAFIVWSMAGPPPAMSFGLITAVSVLIIACPCALGLATPMSIMVGIGRGAEVGVLIKNAEALERLEKADTLILDKTGTLTEGRPKVAKIVAAAGFSEADLLCLAASLERQSEHPLAAAIVEKAQDDNIDLFESESFKAIPGKGVIGRIDQKEVIAGNEALLLDNDISLGFVKEQSDIERRNGASVMFIAIDQKAAGYVVIQDSIKENAKTTLETLRRNGLELIMVTGDNETTARSVAAQLGIETVEANVLPQQKGEIVKRLRNQGKIIAMAGDGINDALALSEADIGIAMGTGTDVAIESAGITLVKGDLNGIVRARQLSKLTMRNIRQNLFFAFAYNSLGIPVAAGILYPFIGVLLNPMIAAAAMSLSSVSIIVNALRLKVSSLT